MTQLPELSLSRQEIRRMIRQRRRVLTPEQQRRFGQQAAARMLSFPPVVMAHTVAVFLSFDGELDTQPLIEQLWQAGKRVYLPVLHPFSPGNLLFLHYHPQSALVTNRLKIREPRLDVRDVLPLAKLDVLVTPLVAFDEDGQRLGMGGGFYDRTL
ncbi:5-formyltetrahydrofolate cyclo-ligase, partial [Salmonella enterica subsp. enterica serovar Agona]|nr:5-formyltetrahydrofolate cyclo-ligase [Salmonella enterica subsp. enterica serovar Agona]